MINPFEVFDTKLSKIESLLLNLIEKQTQTSPQIKQAICLNDASKEYNLSKSFLYKLTSTNEVPHSKRGAKIFFERSVFESWLLENRQKTVQENYNAYQNKKGVHNG